MTEQEFFKGIGSKIKTLRKQAGLTQKDVATKAGIMQPDLATFENKGERIKSADIIRRIVEATGHTMQDVFADAEKKTSPICPPPIRRSLSPRAVLTGS